MRFLLLPAMLFLAVLATGCARGAGEAANAYLAAKNMEKTAARTFSRKNLTRMKTSARRTVQGAKAAMQGAADRTSLRVRQLSDMLRAGMEEVPKPKFRRPSIKISLERQLLRKAQKKKRRR